MDTSYAALKEELRQQKVELQKFKDETDRQQNKTQDLLSTANYAVDVVGLMITVAGIAFGVYLNRLSKQTETSAAKTAEVGQLALLASQAATRAREEAETAAKRSGDIRDWINSDIRIIYKKMQREEVEFIFASLNDAPERINYFEERLTVVTLLDSDFERLSKLLRKHRSELGSGEVDNTYRAYVKFLFVHFAGRLFFEKVPGIEKSVGAVIRSLSKSQLQKVGVLLGTEMLKENILDSKREMKLVDTTLLNLTSKGKHILMLSIALTLSEDQKIIEFLSQMTLYLHGQPMREYYGPLKEIFDEVGHNLVDEDLDFNLRDLIEQIS